MLTAAAAALVLLVAPVAAGGNTQFSAIGTFNPSPLQCDDLPSAYPYAPVVMSGDIVGCWYTDSYMIEQSTPSGTYVETGEETFVGCLADGTTCGTFSTTYRFEGKYAPNGSEIFGRCQHPFVRGTEDFANITGRIDMKDDVVTPRLFIRGHYNLH
jgi:hypothetical protein